MIVPARARYAIDVALLSRSLASGLRIAALAIALSLTSVGSAWAQVAVTDQTIEEQASGYDLYFAYPRVGWPSVDGMIEAWAQARLAGFKSALSARTDREPPYSARLSYAVTRNDAQAVVILFDYSLYTGGAHPNFTQAAFNLLEPDGTQVFLPDLIGTEAVGRVSDLAIADLTAQLTARGYADADWIRTGAGPYADNFETFEWQPSELVLHFDPYAVASYADGPMVVHVPLAAVRDKLRREPRTPLPSFACTSATTPVELAICADQRLAQLDRRVAEAYAARLRLEAISTRPPTVTAQQVAWLGQRDAACAGQTEGALVDCLTDQYTARLAALRDFGE
jgi:uncharacterized protein YecT (DUF1311 family)